MSHCPLRITVKYKTANEHNYEATQHKLLNKGPPLLLAYWAPSSWGVHVPGSGTDWETKDWPGLWEKAECPLDAT